MNVLFLTRRFYPEIGGVERHVFEVSKELVKQGHTVTVITENSLSNYHSKYQSDTYSINSKEPVKSIQTDTSEPKNITIIRLRVGKDSWLKKFRIWIVLLRHVTLIIRSDVVHCHDVFFWYLPFRFMFPTKKVYTTFHGYETKFPPTIKAKIVRKISEKLSTGNICVGEYIKKWYGTKPNYIIYGGVEIPKATGIMLNLINNKKQKIKKRSAKVNILFLGRMEEDNGAKIYEKALKAMKKNNLPYSLVACGDGKYRKIFAKYGKIVGFVNELDKYIDRSDFIFTSSYLSIFEAIIRGKKVFTVAQNNLKFDYLRQSPFAKYIFIASDVQTLISQIEDFVKDPITYRANTLEAYKWAKMQTWGKVVDIYLKLWKL